MNIRKFAKSKILQISICLLLSFLLISTNYTAKSTERTQTTVNPSLSYTDWTPIYINGNLDLLYQAGLYNWNLDGTRLGTEDSPFVISNYRIIGSPTDHLIEIRNTDRYLEIFNCSLIGGEYGIVLEHMSHGIIKENNITDSVSDGIFVYGVNSTRIEWNRITNSSNCGIYFEYSTYNIIYSNTISNNTRGIRTIDSDYNQFYRNTFYNSILDGISVITSDYVGIINNTAFNCKYGIMNVASDNNEIVANSLDENGDGISVVGSLNTSIRANFIYNNSYGIYLLNSDDNICSYNTIDNNTVAIMLRDSDNNIIMINILNDNHEGIRVLLSPSENNLISCNNITYSNNYGVIFEAGTTLNSVTFNNFIGNALLFESQAHDSGNNNTFRNNYWDDWIYGSGPYEIAGLSDNNDPDPSSEIIDIYECGESIEEEIISGYNYLLFLMIIPIFLLIIAVKKQIKR